MLAARTGLSPVMVGRSGALGRLTALVGEPHADGLSAVALVTGEPGVGKTRLIQELISGLPSGVIVLAGGAEPGVFGRPYEVVRVLLDGSLPDTAPDELKRAVVDAIVDRTGEGLTVIVFEDLHWADAESVAVLDLLAVSRLPSTLILITSRPDELT